MFVLQRTRLHKKLHSLFCCCCLRKVALLFVFEWIIQVFLFFNVNVRWGSFMSVFDDYVLFFILCFFFWTKKLSQKFWNIHFYNPFLYSELSKTEYGWWWVLLISALWKIESILDEILTKVLSKILTDLLIDPHRVTSFNSEVRGLIR